MGNLASQGQRLVGGVFALCVIGTLCVIPAEAEDPPVATNQPAEPVQLRGLPKPEELPVAKGPFQPTKVSLDELYKCPEWFADAKFGFWAHWGQAAVSRRGDWYAKNLKRRVGRPAFIRCAHRNDRPFF